MTTKKEFDWSKVIKNFAKAMVSEVVLKAGRSIKQKIDQAVDDFKRRAFGSVLTVVGTIFLLIALAVYINTVVPPTIQWLGWASVGLVIVIVGLIMSRK